MRLTFVLRKKEVITVVPRFPHPIIPIRTAELALVPKATDGLNIVTPEIAEALERKVLRFIGRGL
jgi:hypothetical protein